MDINEVGLHDAGMDMDMDMHDDMDMDVMHTGAELTTAMQAHQHMKQAERKQKQQQRLAAGGGAGSTDSLDGSDATGIGTQPQGNDKNQDLLDGEGPKGEPTCYKWFFGPAVDAQDGGHTTGNALLDYYYEGDPALKQEPIEIKHNSIERKLIYYAFAWLWCGCWEPKYKITNKYAIGEEWICCPKDRGCTCCIKITDSMAYENVDDLQKRQNCWYHLLSCCGCCCRTTCACNDMADIVLIGGDDSHPEGWKLRRIRNATKLYNEVTKIVQDTQKDLSK